MDRTIGVLIGSAFGVIFVLVNSGEPVDPSLSALVRVTALAAFAAILLLTVPTHRSRASATPRAEAPSGDESRSDFFGRSFRVVVTVEFVVVLLGFQLIGLIDAPPETGVAWVAVVVGLHFVVLSRVWREHSILVPGVVLSILGGAGLVGVSTDLVEWVPLVSGVLSGATLLACALVVTGRDFAGRAA